MVVAGYRLFCDGGYLGATMTAVAKEAQVAVQTLYYTFHTKAELFSEVLGAAVVGFDDWQAPPPEPISSDAFLGLFPDALPWWREFESATDAPAALQIFVRHATDVLERVAPLVPAFHGSVGDPDAAAVIERAEQRRVATYQAAARTIASKGKGLRRGITVANATDILLVLLSADVHYAFTNGRGWSRARCEQFSQRVLAGQLLTASAQPG